MLLTDINVDDLNKLHHFRIDRLLCFFTSSLPCCPLQIHAGEILAVHCPNSTIIDSLIDDLEDLRYHAWLILGIKSVVLYFAEEEILRTETFET